MKTRLKIVHNSGNRKIGLGVTCTYRPVGPTCPQDCPLLGERFRLPALPDDQLEEWDWINIHAPRGKCYAQHGFVDFAQTRAEDSTDDIASLPDAGYVRHLVSGDFRNLDSIGRSIVDRSLLRDTIAHHRANPRCHGWAYTHDPDGLEAAGYGPDSWPDNFVILASCESATRAEELQQRGWRTARVSRSHLTRKNEVYCPYDKNKDEGMTADENPVNCRDCGLCLPGSDCNVLFTLQTPGGKR